MKKLVIPKNKYYFNKRNNYISDIRQGVIDLSKLIDELSIKLEIAEDRIDEAIEYIEQHNDYFLLKREVKELLDILKGIELTENDKKQVKWLKEEFNVGVDKDD